MPVAESRGCTVFVVAVQGAGKNIFQISLVATSNAAPPDKGRTVGAGRSDITDVSLRFVITCDEVSNGVFTAADYGCQP